MTTQNLKRGLLLAGALAFVGAASTPVRAQGFFDQLFGSAPPQQQPYYQPPPPQDFFHDFDGTEPRHHKKKKSVAMVDEKPALQKPTDLMHDKTLHYGDAVMMKDGIHVYTGGAYAPLHSQTQFVALDRARQVPGAERSKLAALDTTRFETTIEHRSSTEITSGFKITDGRGNSVRYVGP